MKIIGFSASEEMSFENVNGRTDDGRTTDTFIYYKLTYEPSAQVSLKVAGNGLAFMQFSFFINLVAL